MEGGYVLMALSDMAEYWWKEPKMPYMGRTFIHIPNSTCGHINPQTGNTDVSEYLNDITCFACLKLLKTNGNIYNLKEGISKLAQSRADKLKFKYRYGTCECGHPLKLRINSKTQEMFYGCTTYPKCKKTKSL